MHAALPLHSGLRALLACLAIGVGLTSRAQSVATAPVGAVVLEAPANSDSYFSIPLVRPAVYEGVVEAKSGNALTLKSASFAAGGLQYQAGVQSNTYYAQIASGSAAGQFSTILSNTAQAVTCEYEQDILDSVQVGDKIVIRPYWTLGTVFPDSAAGTYFVASTSNLSSGRRTEILFPDLVTVGVNKSPNSIYYYNLFWRRVGAVSVNRNDVIIPPDTFFVIRGNAYSASTKTVVTGVVQLNPSTVSLLTSSAGKNDNPLGTTTPVPMAFSALNLTASGAFTASTSNLSSGRGDEILVFDNSQIAKNKAPSAIYYFNSFWRKVGETSVNHNTSTIPVGAALIVRKKQGALSQVVDWQQPAVVLN